jgi:hypothetical protein
LAAGDVGHTLRRDVTRAGVVTVPVAVVLDFKGGTLEEYDRVLEMLG